MDCGLGLFDSPLDGGVITTFQSFALLNMFLFGCGLCFLFDTNKRGTSLFDQRLHWSRHCQKHTAQGTFKRRLRMNKESFDILLSLIYHDLLVNEQCANLRGGTIIPELCLCCTLRWLAGGSHLDIVDNAGTSKSSFCRVIWKTIVAMAVCPELELKWPSYPNETQDAISGFTRISFEQAITNCAGVVDGFLVRTRNPSKSEVGNVRSFFSGHHQCCGINCQAVTDSCSRFTHFAVAAPGVSKDRDASKHCGLSEPIEDLPDGVCVIGDAAHEPSEHMVPVHQGQQRLIKKYDDFNFYASQLRIRVEMAFGMMTKKWGILNRPLTCSFFNIKWLMQAIARLHNFVINERIRLKEKEEMMKSVAEGRAFLPSVPHDSNGDPVRLDAVFSYDDALGVESFSALREAMVDRVLRLKLTRPASNRIPRKNAEEEEEEEEETNN